MRLKFASGVLAAFCTASTLVSYAAVGQAQSFGAGTSSAAGSSSDAPVVQMNNSTPLISSKSTPTAHPGATGDLDGPYHGQWPNMNIDWPTIYRAGGCQPGAAHVVSDPVDVGSWPTWHPGDTGGSWPVVTVWSIQLRPPYSGIPWLEPGSWPANGGDWGLIIASNTYDLSQATGRPDQCYALSFSFIPVTPGIKQTTARLGSVRIMLRGSATDKPTASTENPREIRSTSVSLSGSVTAEGLSTTSHFEYGTTSAYGSSTSALELGAGYGPVTATQTLRELSPGTTYHFRLVASNAAGTNTSTDQTFSTKRVLALRVRVRGSAGAITTNPQSSIRCPLRCIASYEEGTSVTLVAKPGARSNFSRWEGACHGTKPRCAVTMVRAKLATAVFSRKRG